MNIFNVKKRKTLSYEEWKKQSKIAQTPKHIKKGESELTADSMLGDIKGAEGIAVRDDDHAKLIKKKHDATKATYGGAVNGKEGYETKLSEHVNSYDQYLSEAFSYPRGWALLAAGKINLHNGDSTHFNVIENNKEGGYLVLVKKDNKYVVLSSAGTFKEDLNKNVGDYQKAYHDQSMRPFEVKIEKFFPTNLESLKEIGEITKSKTLPFMVFK